MSYLQLLFTYNEKLSCLTFNEITMWNLVNKMSESKKLQITNESYLEYLSKWFTILSLDLKQLQIIGLIQSNNTEYSIIINEETKQIKLFENNIDFNSKYKEFLESNELWDGTVYAPNELDLQYWLNIKKSKQLKETIRALDKITNNRIQFLNNVINSITDTNANKQDQYKTLKATLIAKNYKCAITNYKKINLKKFIIPIYVKSQKYSEKRISKTYSLSKYEIECITNDELFSVTYGITMVDDGHDYYASHTHNSIPEYKFSSNSPFTELYMEKCLQFIMLKFFRTDI